MHTRNSSSSSGKGMRDNDKRVADRLNLLEPLMIVYILLK